MADSKHPPSSATPTRPAAELAELAFEWADRWVLAKYAGGVAAHLGSHAPESHLDPGADPTEARIDPADPRTGERG